MSFVYAQRLGQSIAVFADTKITFADNAPRLFSEETEKRVRQFGMIKNIIVSKNFCICFAGNNIAYANELLQQINSVSLAQILQLALDINRKNPTDGAEFIICYADKRAQQIYQIKDGVCEEVPLAWIGSYQAFSYFQGVRQGIYTQKINSNIPYSYEIKSESEPLADEDHTYRTLLNAFFKTIFDCGDNSVGGFVVPALFDLETNQFWYKGYCRSFSKMQVSIKGLSMPMYQGPSAGAYSILFYQSSQNVGVYIPENHFGIIYNHYRPNPDDYKIAQTSSFLTPYATKTDQLDFYVQTGAHGMSPPGFLGIDPDRIDDYLKRVWHYRNNPELAILYIDKAIEIIEQQHRDDWRYSELLSIQQNIQAGL
jgi:hypothetical protein